MTVELLLLLLFISGILYCATAIHRINNRLAIAEELMSIKKTVNEVEERNIQLRNGITLLRGEVVELTRELERCRASMNDTYITNDEPHFKICEK